MTTPNGTITGTDADGNETIIPATITPGGQGGGKADSNESQDLQFVDYNSLVAPFINFRNAFDFAQGVGRDNKESYYGNITSQRSKDAALGLVDTDIQGILRGLDGLIPRARQEGDQDTETNISRGGRIDQFNFSRLPQFNEFNRGEVSQNNDFNRSEREESINASGVNYRGRVSKILNQLSDQSEGRMSDDLLDTLITRTNRDRGADIGAASGISGYSGAGRNIQDLLDVDQRIGLALDAQKTLPGVAAQAQSILQPPEEQLRTTTAVPTNVPLNTSTIEQRVPITSNISAGAAQQSIGTQATQIETIPATQAFQSRLQTDQFNEEGRYNRDVKVLDSTQAQFTAQDVEDQRAGLQDTADAQFAASQEAYYAGLQQRADEARTRAITGGVGGIGSTIASSPTVQQGLQDLYDYITGGSSGGSSSGSNSGGGYDPATDGYDLTQGPGAPPATVFGGGAETAATGGGETNYSSDGGGNYDLSAPGGAPPALDFSSGGAGGSSGGGSTGGSNSTTDFFSRTTKPLPETGLDAEVVLNTAATVSNFDRMTPAQQIQAFGNLGTQVAVSQGYVNQERGGQIQTVNNSVGTLLNPNSTTGQRTAALGNMALQVRGTTFGGSVNNPTTVGNVPVTGQTTMPDGSRGFQLSDGSTVSQESLLNGSNAVAAVNAFGVLTSNADNETKLEALTNIGVSQAAANLLISQVTAGNGVAALSLFSTGRNFNDMSVVEQSAAIMQTTNAVTSAAAASTAGSTFAATNTGASVLGFTSGVSSALSQVVPVLPTAIYAANTIKDKTIPVLKGDMSYQDALNGQLPGIQAISTALGSGRNTGRKMRDGWRSGLQEAGIADENYNVTLADGSKYDIGQDDGAKLVNKDGVERNTFDIDWGDKATTNAIPDAHLFALATGLDPTSNEKADTFHRATAQALNGATSNADTPEGIQANLKAMMKDVKPETLMGRVESLRLSEKITDQEYGVYVDRVNKMYGTEFKPQDKQKSLNSTIAQLKQTKDLPKPAQEFLELLTSQRKLESNRRAREKRLE